MLEIYKSAAGEQVEVSSCIGRRLSNCGATQDYQILPEAPTFSSHAVVNQMS